MTLTHNALKVFVKKCIRVYKTASRANWDAIDSAAVHAYADKELQAELAPVEEVTAFQELHAYVSAV